MERAPKNEDVLDFEKTAYGVWEHRRDTAPEEAEALIAGIEGFESMSAKEQLRTLQEHLVRLSDESNPNFNDNRALVQAIAKRMKAIEVTDVYQTTMDRLADPSPAGQRILTEA